MVVGTRRRVVSLAQELRIVELENLRLRAENEKLSKWQNSAAAAAVTEDGKYTGDHLTHTEDASHDGLFRSSLRGEDKPPPPPSQQSAKRRPERPASAPLARPGSARRSRRAPRNNQSPERQTPAMGHGAHRPSEALRYQKAQSSVVPSARIPWDRPPPKVTLPRSPRLGKPGIGHKAETPLQAPRHLEVQGSSFGSRSTPSSPSNLRHQQRPESIAFEGGMPESTQRALVAPPDGPSSAPFVLGFVDPDSVAKLDQASKHRTQALEQRKKEKVRQLSRYEPPPRWSPSFPSAEEIQSKHGAPVRNTVRCRFSGPLSSQAVMCISDWVQSFKDGLALLLASALEIMHDKVHVSVVVKDIMHSKSNITGKRNIMIVSVTLEVPGSADKIAAALRGSLESGALSKKLEESKEPNATLQEFLSSNVQLMTLLISERHEWSISKLGTRLCMHGDWSCLESPAFGLDGCGGLVLQLHPRGMRSHGTRNNGRVVLHLSAPALDLPTFSFVLTIGSGERWIGPFGRFGSQFVPGGVVCSPDELLALTGQNGDLTIGVEAIGEHSGASSLPHTLSSGQQSKAPPPTKTSTQIRVPLTEDAIYKLGLEADQRQKVGAAFADAEDRATTLVNDTKALERGLQELALRCKAHTDASLVACGLAGPAGQGNLQQSVDSACEKAEQCKQSLATASERSTALERTVEELRNTSATEAGRVSAIEGVVEQLRSEKDSAAAAPPQEIPGLEECIQQSQTTVEQVSKLQSNLDVAVSQIKEDVLGARTAMDQDLSKYSNTSEELRQLIHQEKEQSAKALETFEAETAKKLRVLEEQAENAQANTQSIDPEFTASVEKRIAALELTCESTAESSKLAATIEDRIAALEEKMSMPAPAPASDIGERDERIAALEAEVLALKELTMKAAAAVPPAAVVSTDSAGPAEGAAKADAVKSPAADAPVDAVTSPAADAPVDAVAPEAVAPPADAVTSPSDDAPVAADAPKAIAPDAPADVEEVAPTHKEEEKVVPPQPEEHLQQKAEDEESDAMSSLAEDETMIMDQSIQQMIRMEDVEHSGLVGSYAATEYQEDDRSLCSDADNTLLEEASGDVGAFLSPKARSNVDNVLDEALGLLPEPSEATEELAEDRNSDVDNEAILDEASGEFGEAGALLSPKAGGKIDNALDAALGFQPEPSEVEDFPEDHSDVDVSVVTDLNPQMS